MGQVCGEEYEMNECETAIAKGKLAMLAYLEGKQLFIAGRWQTVKKSRVMGKYREVNFTFHNVGYLEHFCREARECVSES